MSLPETTLGNPLVEAPYSEFAEAYASPKERYKGEVGRAAQSLARTPGSPHLSLIKTHDHKATPALAELGYHLVPVEVAVDYLAEVGPIVQDMIIAVNKGIAKCSNRNYPGLPPIDVSRLHEHPILVFSLRLTIYWLNVVDKIILATKGGRWMKWKGAWISRRMSLIPLRGEYHMLTTDACLMFKDMLYSRFLIHLYCHVDPRKRHMSPKLSQYVEWGKLVLEDRGNTGYDILKGIEALTQTGLILREETILDGVGQHKSMLDKYRAKELAIGGTGIHTDRLEQYIASFESSEDLAEAFGFLKLWGHPYVDPRSGCVSAKTLAQQDLDISPSACLQLQWSFCHLYCRGYLKKKGRWPPLVFLERGDLPKTKLQTLKESGKATLAFGFTQYPASDWEWTQFGHDLTFDEGDDILKLVTDRAISYKRSEFDASWPHVLPYRTPKATSSNRVLEELVTRPSFDLSEVTRRVAARDIPFDWRIVTVSPKEREMKRDPRMFSMMVMEMRLFFVLTEHNIAEGVFQYIPEQTMTMGRQELLEVFLQSTRPLPGTWVRAVLGIDFSRWNLYWRGETVHPIGRRMNEIYGKAGVFDVVHDFFESSMCLLRQGGYPPDNITQHNRHNPPEGRTLWYNHKGGFEGIAQKLWTAATVALVHMALWPLGLSYRIIGQGDNQVCILDCYVPPGTASDSINQYIRNLVDRASTQIAATSLLVGQVVKPEECISSTCFLTYGKEMILRGAYLPTSLKYVSRLFPSTTGDAPSLHEMISSISSGAVGAPDRNSWSYPTFIMAKLAEGLTLKRELKHSLFHGQAVLQHARLVGLYRPEGSRATEKELLTLMLSVPSNLGGLPITTISELLYRGHSDPLSSSLLHLSLLAAIPIVDQYQRVILKGWMLNPSPEIESLIMDPYAIPLSSSPVPSSAIAKETGEVLPGITHNPQFRELFDRSSNTDRDSLMRWLSTMRPFYPKIAHDMYKSSLIGLRDSFVKRFSNTRTIISIGRRADKNLAGVSLASDLNWITKVIDRLHLAWKVGLSEPSYTPDQHYRVAIILRRAWMTGTELDGVTNGHPLAVGRLEWFPGPDRLSERGCRIQVMGLSSPSHLCSRTRGPVVPYLGSGTGDKAVARWVKPVDSSPPLHDVLRLLSIRSMISVSGSSLWSSLTAIAQSRSNVSVDSLEQLLRIKIGGTLAHRFATRDDPRGSFWNSCFNWPTHLTISTNQSGTIGEQDYPFDFKEAMLSLSSLTSWAYSGTHTPAPWGIQLVVDPRLMDPVADRIVQAGEWDPPMAVPTDNYYTTVREVRVSTHALSAARLAQGLPVLPFISVESPIHSALTVVLWHHIRTGNPVTTRFGHTIGVPSSKRIIDIPELYSVTTEEMLEGLGHAIWAKIGYSAAAVCTWKSRKADQVISQMWDLEVRRSVPSLSGTLRCVDHQSPSHGLGIGLGRNAEIDALARWMHTVSRLGKREIPKGPFTVYLRGVSSVSSTLVAGLGLLSLRECASKDRSRYQNGKLLQRLTDAARSKPDEVTRVRLLVAIIDACQLSSFFQVDSRSPEEALRELRQRPSPDNQLGNLGQVTRIIVDIDNDGGAEGGTSQLVVPLYRPSPSDLVHSWIRRPFPFPAAAERWSPIRDAHGGRQKVLLLGVGQGDIGGAFPLDWTIVGVELATQLQTLGHDSTTYQPPGLAGRFSLHQVSWSKGGDVTSAQVQRVLCDDIRADKYTMVVIDIEGVSNEERLGLRHRLAAEGIPAYCKVYVDPSFVDEFLASYWAYRLPGDRIWTTASYPDREFIIGCSPSPIGLYASVPSPDRFAPSPFPPSWADYTHKGYPQYNPGPDLLCLTGHTPVLTRDGLSRWQCRSIRSYWPDPWPKWTGDVKLDTLSLCETLVRNGCPRVRVKAFISLVRNDYITDSFFSRL